MERRTRAAPNRPGQGPRQSSAGRRSLPGAWLGTAPVETPWVVKPTFGRFVEGQSMLHAWIGLSTGRVWPVRCSGRSLRGPRKTGRRHTAEAHPVVMLFGQGGGAKE